MEIFCECQDCKHSANVDVESNLKDINNIIDKITCSKCSSKNINIFFQNVLIYSFSNRKECRICGKVIIEPRKNLTDNSDTCCACAQRIEEDSEKIYKTQNDDTYTVIKKCIDKGAVGRSEPGFICRALISRKEVQEVETNELIDKMYDGSSDKLIAALLGSKRLTAEEIQSLKKLVEELK